MKDILSDKKNFRDSVPEIFNPADDVCRIRLNIVIIFLLYI